jgi:AGZA family xanthine/uracil permease-like MFS transporter
MSYLEWLEERLDIFFDITRRGSTVGTEIRAGLTSFLTLSYLLLVNPQVLGKAGMNPEDVVTAMCLSCGIPTLLSGLCGNLPFVMAPGLGLSAYLTYGLVGASVSPMTWQEAMGCIFIAGIIMALLTVTDLVTKSMKYVPGHIKLATIIGIGLLLATIGFESAGVIAKGTLADNLVTPAAWPAWTALGGLIVIAVLNFWNVPGAIVVGVIGVSLVLWGGRSSWPTKFVEFPEIEDTWMKLSLKSLKPETAIPAVATFLLVALFDCSGCLIGLSRKAGIIGHVDDPVPGGAWALVACSLGTIISACTGNSPIIIAVECTAGIVEGGRTGLKPRPCTFNPQRYS